MHSLKRETRRQLELMAFVPVTASRFTATTRPASSFFVVTRALLTVLTAANVYTVNDTE